MDNKRILVVDDNDLFRESIVETLSRKGYGLYSAKDGHEALELLKNSDFDLVISDMKMPGMTGIELLEQIRKFNTEIPFLIITAYGAIETAVEAMKKGAFDFIQKSDNLINQLEITVDRTLRYQSLVSENRRLKTALREKWNFIGNGSRMNEIRDLAASVAESRSTVLITGESGTGKEMVARFIHYQSKRCNGPFIKINCAALPEGLIESELFGHEKGAFTGAISRKLGKFEAASGGTLLLDEIGEMPMSMQAKLLRVLQEREIDKVGGDQPVEIDVRVIATTNRNLEKDVADGKFREDLFYRLNVFRVHLPPLRDRKDDISRLVEHFISKYNNENGFSVQALSDEAVQTLVQYEWPGNIRELENAIERAVVLTRTGIIPHSKFKLSSSSANHPCDLQAGMTVAEMEKVLIFKTLESCEGNRTKAAEMLGISIRTLRNKLHEYGAFSDDSGDVSCEE